MSDEAIRVPAGLTTDGLLGRRYLARCIDSVFIALLMLRQAVQLASDQFAFAHATSLLIVRHSGLPGTTA